MGVSTAMVAGINGFETQLGRRNLVLSNDHREEHILQHKPVTRTLEKKVLITILEHFDIC